MSPLRFLPKNGSRVYYHYIYRCQSRRLTGMAIAKRRKLIVEIQTGRSCRLIHYIMGQNDMRCTRAKKMFF